VALSKQRKVFIGLLSLAVGALFLDRGVLGPAGASAGVIAPDAAAKEAGPAGAVSSSPVSALTSAIAQRVRSVVEEKVGASMPAIGGDPFDLSGVLGGLGGGDAGPADNGEPANAPAGDADRIAPDRPAEPVLTAAMPSRSGGMAIFDGRPVRAGEAIGDSGWVLRTVGRGGVEIEKDGRVRLLRLPNYSDLPPAGNTLP
jgi:hypothetical protein